MKFNEWITSWAKRQARENRRLVKRGEVWLAKTERESQRRLEENRQESHAISVAIYLRAVTALLAKNPPNRAELESIKVELRTLKLQYQNLRHAGKNSPRRETRENLEERFLRLEVRISNYEESNGVSFL